jgi:xylulokinase
VGLQREAALLERVEALTDAERDRAPIFLPYLSGERTPHNDAHAQGLFFGLTHETDAARLGHAVIEGVAFGLADGLHALQEAGTEVRRLSLVGVGSRSAHWSQLLADVLGVELVTAVGAEAGGAMGAARLAWLALGREERAVCKPPETRASFLPRAERRAPLAERHARFRELYRSTRALLPRA